MLIQQTLVTVMQLHTLELVVRQALSNNNNSSKSFIWVDIKDEIQTSHHI